MAIHNIIWNGTRLRVQSYNVLVGDAQLELKRCFRNSEGTPLLMVPGFLETTSIFMPKHPRAGLAPFLASRGFDVYLAELRGKGNSWPSAGRNSRWGLHEAVCEDMPSHLGMIEKLRPGVPQFWLGHGLGSLLMCGAYARIDELPAPLLGMVHVSAGRHCSLDNWRKTLHYQSWLSALTLQNLFKGCVAIPFDGNVRRETRFALQALLWWQRDAEWADSRDQFDYGAALRSKTLPPSLYLANSRRSLWGNIDDCRRWIAELGDHDCRLIMVSKAAGNARNYNFHSILRSPMACDDHFLQLQSWLQEHAEYNTNDAVADLMEA